MKILILSCSTGGGHNSCAKYIQEELKENNIPCEFKDFYNIVNANAKELSEKIYLSTLGGNGQVFKNIYKLGELYSKTKTKSPVYLVNKFHQKSLYNYITENNFDLIIATHLFPALTLTAINKNKNYQKINFITIATDYEPCPFLEETKPDHLVVAKDLNKRFLSKGIKKTILTPLGIPVSTRFITTAKDIRKELNIKDEKIILIMLGSMGFGKITNIISSISQEENVKIIIVCGSNKKLLSELTNLSNPNLIPLGFVNNINDLIYTSDVVLSKPGGLSSTEIASIGKPLIHIYPIPGIETYNTNYFSTRKMSLSCQKEEEIITSLRKILQDEKLQKRMIKNQHKYIPNTSAKDLVNLIKEKYN